MLDKEKLLEELYDYKIKNKLNFTELSKMSHINVNTIRKMSSGEKVRPEVWYRLKIFLEGVK